MKRLALPASARAEAGPLLLSFQPHVLRRLEMQPVRPVLKFPEVGEERPEPPLVLSAALRLQRYLRRERLT